MTSLDANQQAEMGQLTHTTHTLVDVINSLDITLLRYIITLN